MLTITATIANKRYAVHTNRPIDLSIPLRFDGVQLAAFGAPPATMKPYEAGGFVGEVNRGGSCNCFVYKFAAHTSGTHTECVGHISRKLIAIREILSESFIPATVISVTPQWAGESNENYDPPLQAADGTITRRALEAALQNCDRNFLSALIVRTLPNDAEKRLANYNETAPPFFSSEAMRYLVELDVMHLLVDFPSVDRLNDEGKLSNHHRFWNVPQGSHEVDPANCSRKSITELIYVPNETSDGIYLLQLQVPPFMSDAAPSRPLLFELSPA